MGRIVHLVEQNGGESTPAMTAHLAGEGGFAQVPVNKQDFSSGFGKGCGQVGRGEGFAFPGGGGSEHNHMPPFIGTGKKGIDVVAQDMEAFCHHRLFLLNEERGVLRSFCSSGAVPQ